MRTARRHGGSTPTSVRADRSPGRTRPSGVVVSVAVAQVLPAVGDGVVVSVAVAQVPPAGGDDP
eukprot:7041410-Alexandrium_andersonii.AAC.1